MFAKKKEVKKVKSFHPKKIKKIASGKVEVKGHLQAFTCGKCHRVVTSIDHKYLKCPYCDK